jgi:2-hydroxy-4-carboxymuconate semialdehyde hemiacetal dehydrogenase
MRSSSVVCAIVGYGAIAEEHAAALAAAGATLRAVVGPSREAAGAFADRHKIPLVYNDLDTVLQLADLDAVVIASPSAVHAVQATTALSAGKHVLCEIPVGLSLGEAETVDRASAIANRVTMVCHTQRYWPSIVALVDMVKQRQLTTRQVVARTAMRRHDNVGWTGRRRSWVDNLLWHHGCHLVDTTLLLIGEEPSAVFAVSGPPFAETGLAMDIGILIRSREGALGTISLSYNSKVGADDFLVIADQDAFMINQGRLLGPGGAVLAGGQPDEMLRRAVAAQDREFLTAIATGLEPSTSIQRALPAMRVLQEVETQQSITLLGRQ